MARPGSKLGQAGTAEKKGRYLSAFPPKCRNLMPKPSAT
jgi:hypothetical protein